MAPYAVITTDLQELLLACRRGDFDKVRYLVEKKEVAVNVRDKWESTPLYYACYCGHKEIVRFLLAHGAKCEVNTFDGERCIYGALTDEIRNLLRSFKVVTSRIMMRHTYDEFVRKLFETTDFMDVLVTTRDGTEHKCHKCILMCRSKFFRDLFSEDLKCSHVALDFKSGHLFKLFKEFVYTGRMQAVIDRADYREFLRMGKLLQIDNYVDNTYDASRFIKRELKFRVNIDVVVSELAQSFAVLSEDGIRVGPNYLPCKIERPAPASCADVCFYVDGYYFFAHKLFYCQRSDYFSALLRDHFHETQTIDGIPVVSLSKPSAEVFACIHEYMYKDSTSRLDKSNVFDVLYAADPFLLNGLKRYCGSYVADYLDLENTMSVLRCARTFQLTRLEDQCVAFIANNLVHFLGYHKEFEQQVLEDAEGVKARQETDSIAIIDDIRYHISANVQTAVAMQKANEKLFFLDKFLLRLGLEA